MTSLWTGIPFRHPSEPTSADTDADVQSYDMYHDMKQDDGMHAGALEHHRSDPQVAIPAHAVHPDTLQSISNPHLGDITENRSTPEEKTPKSKPRLPRSVRRYWILILAIFLGVVALALGLGLGLTMRNKPHGAEVGSGISAIDRGDGSARMTLYVQHSSGQIRQAQEKDGVWTG